MGGSMGGGSMIGESMIGESMTGESMTGAAICIVLDYSPQGLKTLFLWAPLRHG